jgi:hypothetical protein
LDQSKSSNANAHTHESRLLPFVSILNMSSHWQISKLKAKLDTANKGFPTKTLSLRSEPFWAANLQTHGRVQA